MKKQSGKDKEIEVSFIIVNYNGGEILERAIRSIKEQDFPEDKREIILVDNNSGDGSADVFADDKSIALIRSDKNLGFAGGNNLGIDKSSGKYLALINNDVLLDRDWTKKIVSKMNSDDKIGIMGNEIFLRDTGIVWHGGAKIFFPGFVKHLNIKKESEMNFVNFASVMIRRDANVRFDENFFMYYEDVDYCRQIMKKGLKIVYMPEAKSYHFIKPRRASATEEYYINRNRVYYYAKELTGFTRILFLVGDIIFFFPIFSAYRVLRQPNRLKYLGKIIKARIDSIRMLR